MRFMVEKASTSHRRKSWHRENTPVSGATWLEDRGLWCIDIQTMDGLVAFIRSLGKDGSIIMTEDLITIYDNYVE